MTNVQNKKKLSTLDITLMGLMSAIIAVCSWISIPSVVPFTMQTFAVFLTLLVLGGVKGTLSILVYISIGAVGAPVFAGFKGGIGALLGPTGGYILGFLFIGLFMIILNLFTKKWYFELAICILGLAVCYAFGTAWFLHVMSSNGKDLTLGYALSNCVIPFIIPDLIKLSLSFAIAKQLQRIKPLQR